MYFLSSCHEESNPLPVIYGLATEFIIIIIIIIIIINLLINQGFIPLGILALNDFYVGRGDSPSSQP